MLADDLMAAVFPDAAACLENIPGDRQIPDHPLVAQTIRDCLQEAMDFGGLASVLGRIHAGELTLVARDTPEPSVFAHEILNAKPYAFLDDAPLEERRAHAVQVRRAGEDASAGLGALDPAAIARVREETRCDPRDADELHDALLTAGFLEASEQDAIDPSFFDALAQRRRATRADLGRQLSRAAVNGSVAGSARAIWIAAERLPELLAVHPAATLDPIIAAPASRAVRQWTRTEALVELLRGRITILGPITASAMAESLCVSITDVDDALLALEADGAVLRGHFSGSTDQTGTWRLASGANTASASMPESRIPNTGALPSAGSERRSTPAGPVASPESRSPTPELEWCDRALLSRIHRYTLHSLRAEIEPVSPADFMRFLFAWQHVDRSAMLTGIDGLREVVATLDGYELAAGAWERAVLPSRVSGYEPQLLDMLCLAGEVGWARLSSAADASPACLVPATPIALFLREHADAWQRLRSLARDEPLAFAPALNEDALRVLDALRVRGASFFNDLGSACALPPDSLRTAIGALVACGLAASDGFSGLRALAWGGVDKTPRHRAQFAGRWSALSPGSTSDSHEADIETLARVLLRRYGVVFRRVLTREANAVPWRALVRVYRRLEARGEIRGGRFVSGMSGEQFALPEAVQQLREVRRTPASGRVITISAADPLNLAGIITPGDRLRAASRNRIACRDGCPVAVLEGDFVRELAPMDPAIAAEVTRALSRRRGVVTAR
jgi:ATP-dependent helicase Lhr and Lhr-like helicase